MATPVSETELSVRPHPFAAHRVGVRSCAEDLEEAGAVNEPDLRLPGAIGWLRAACGPAKETPPGW